MSIIIIRERQNAAEDFQTARRSPIVLGSCVVYSAGHSYIERYTNSAEHRRTETTVLHCAMSLNVICSGSPVARAVGKSLMSASVMFTCSDKVAQYMAPF
jgi:hypothetical protein